MKTATPAFRKKIIERLLMCFGISIIGFNSLLVIMR